MNTGRESTVKSFLRSHQKSGPFLEDNDSAIRVKRLSGLKSVSSKDKVQVITKAMSFFFYETEFEIWAGRGSLEFMNFCSFHYILLVVLESRV